LTYDKLTETQTSGTNFATVQTVQKTDFISKVIECPIGLSPLLWRHCYVGVIILFPLKRN